MFYLIIIPLMNVSSQTNTDDNKEIILPLELNEFGIPHIELSIGTPKQTIKVFLSTVLPKLYIASSKDKEIGFNDEASITLENNSTERIIFPSIGNGCSGKKVKDTLSINSNILSNYPFIMIDQGDVSYYYRASLGFEYQSVNEEEEEYSFVTNLYRRNIINYQMFYIKREKNSYKLVIGNAPSNTYKKNYKICNLIRKDNFGLPNSLWQCTLHAIYLDDFTFIQVEQPISFSLGGNIICVNKHFYEIFKDKYFISSLTNHNCVEDVQNKRYFIRCNDDFSFPKAHMISFVFDKWNIKFNLNSLFLPPDYNNQKRFCIMNCEQTQINFSIGYKNLGITTLVFDKENSLLWLGNE